VAQPSRDRLGALAAAIDSGETTAFARRLMKEVWEPFDAGALPRFYHRDVIGHHRAQEIRYADIENRLVRDQQRFADPLYDIQDVVADRDKFAIRFVYTAKTAATGEPVRAEVNYFYHLRDGKIAEFWLLADLGFDYKA
jgi:predicted ester cyclase